MVNTPRLDILGITLLSKAAPTLTHDTTSCNSWGEGRRDRLSLTMAVGLGLPGSKAERRGRAAASGVAARGGAAVAAVPFWE